jgi:hypothetical protein
LNLPLSSQLFGFAVSVAGGLVLGALYDLFRIWRILFRSGRRAVFFQDIFYLFLAALFTFLLALGVSLGEVRFYLVAGEAAGWLLYHFSVGLVTVRLFRFVAKVLNRFLFAPLKKLLLTLWNFVKKILIFSVKSIKKVFSNRKNSLKRRSKVVYNQRKDHRGSRRRKKDVFRREGHSK